jgi:hypothetical protein
MHMSPFPQAPGGLDAATADAFDLGIAEGPAGDAPDFSSEDCTNTCHTQPNCFAPALIA